MNIVCTEGYKEITEMNISTTLARERYVVWAF
jgi:hypothetical protein